MGSIYQVVVEKCLTRAVGGTLNISPGDKPEGKIGRDGKREKERISFYWDVVAELEKCKA